MPNGFVFKPSAPTLALITRTFALVCFISTVKYFFFFLIHTSFKFSSFSFSSKFDLFVSQEIVDYRHRLRSLPLPDTSGHLLVICFKSIKMRWGIVGHRRSLIHITLTLVMLMLTAELSHGFLKHLSHREARKLVKLALAASFFTPPGVGVLPIPLPLPIPFSIESVKPPIIHPFHPGFPIL